MMSGMSHQGGFRSSMLLYRFEHRANACQIVLSKQDYANFPREGVGEPSSATLSVVDPGGGPSLDLGCDVGRTTDVHEFCGDATHQDAIDKMKMYVSKLSSSSFGGSVASVSHDGKVDIDELVLPCVESQCDLQVCELGTGAETYSLVVGAFSSVGAPSWEDRANQYASGRSQRISVYNFGFDKGPDCVGCIGRVRARIATIPFVMFAVCYCFFHQLHLGCKDLVAVLDAWTWDLPECADVVPTVSYFNAVSAIAGAWRYVGIPRKVSNAAAELVTDDEGALKQFSKLPGIGCN